MIAKKEYKLIQGLKITILKSQSKILRKNKIELDEDLHSCIIDLFNAERQFFGEEFFNLTIQKLNRHLNADYVFIAKINEAENRLESVAFCNQEEIFTFNKLSYGRNNSVKKVIEQRCSKFLEKYNKR